tara:strand:- start:135 stop:374 length:240 start_codon:yes stop_codon:yes gene_type:complete
MVSKLRAKTRKKPSPEQRLKNRLRYATGPKIEQRLNKELSNKSLLRQLGLPLEVLGTKVAKIAKARYKYKKDKKKQGKK